MKLFSLIDDNNNGQINQLEWRHAIDQWNTNPIIHTPVHVGDLLTSFLSL